MAHRATVGRDVTEEYNQELLPYLTSDTLRYFWGSRFSNGYRYQTRREVVFDTYDYSGSLNFDLPRAFKSTTSLGLQYYIKSFDNAAVQGEGFPTPDVSTVAAAANKTFQTQDYSDNRTLGAFLQQQIGWRDRLFVTGAVRVDNNSAFGADVDFVVYPKAQVSWVVNEEPFFQRNGPSWFNTLRLRGAFGESGQHVQTNRRPRGYGRHHATGGRKPQPASGARPRDRARLRRGVRERSLRSRLHVLPHPDA
jgi:hypothetical protein